MPKLPEDIRKFRNYSEPGQMGEGARQMANPIAVSTVVDERLRESGAKKGNVFRRGVGLDQNFRQMSLPCQRMVQPFPRQGQSRARG
jgi:hypothetical protein